MGFTVVALVLGLVLGLATGGRPSNVNRRPIRAFGAGLRCHLLLDEPFTK